MAAGNSIDEIIELYKRDVDVTLLDECLRRTVDERLRALENFSAAIDELRKGTSAIIGSISHGAETYGPRLIQLGIALLRGHIVPPYNYVRHHVVTAESLTANERPPVPA